MRNLYQKVSTPGRNKPCNGATNRQYNGVNVVLLWIAMRDHHWPTARFVTFKQALELGGHVRKGEHSTKIYFVRRASLALLRGLRRSEPLVVVPLKLAAEIAALAERAKGSSDA